MEGLRLVMPVTTASGNSTGTTGVGVGTTVGDGEAVAAGDAGVAPAEGTGEGFTEPHAASSSVAATGKSRRTIVDGAVTGLW
jgi:hypothetical protein